MAERLSIVMFVDACGFEVARSRPWFLKRVASHRQRVTSLFGYSSACVPAILSGRRPDENDHWSAFYYAPETSPFRSLRTLRHLPGRLVDRGRVRRHLSGAIAKAYGYTGYFQIYNVPFDVLPLLDYAEKRDIFAPGGINRGTSIFDELVRRKINYHVSDWRAPEAANIASLEDAVSDGKISFAFLYTAGLDALMHDHTKDSPAVDDKLRWYEEHIGSVLSAARERYAEVRFALFSDHGMATVNTVVDWMPRIEGTGLTFGRDYVAVYDSTMLRFWFLTSRAEATIRSALPDCAQGGWVSEQRLIDYGTYWPSGRFGHAIYALEPGVVLNPSHMGQVALKGMHGYRPDHPDSDSALLASFEPETHVERITDLYQLMVEMAAWSAPPPP